MRCFLGTSFRQLEVGLGVDPATDSVVAAKIEPPDPIGLLSIKYWVFFCAFTLGAFRCFGSRLSMVLAPFAQITDGFFLGCTADSRYSSGSPC
jgi:hypothetical protein